MRVREHNILNRIKLRWQMRLWAEVLMYALGSTFLIWFLFSNFLFSLIAFLIIGGLLGFIKRPWELDLQSVSSYLDLHLENLEYSTGLLLLPREELSGIAKLQQEKTSRELETEIKNVKPQDGLLRAIIISAVVILFGFLITKT